MLLHFDSNDYVVIGGALLLLVFIAYFLRQRFPSKQRYLNFAAALTLIVNPLLLICFFAKIFFFTESYPRTVLNSWGYVKAVGTISILCEMMAVYLIYEDLDHVVLYQRCRSSLVSFRSTQASLAFVFCVCDLLFPACLDCICFN